LGLAAGYGLVLVAAVGYGTLGPLSELARAWGVSSFAFSTGRVFVGAVLVVGALAVWRPELVSHTNLVQWLITAREGRILLAMGVLTGLVNLALVAAIAETSVAVGLLIFYTYPAFVAIVSFAWLGERLRLAQWIALALAMAGTALVVAGPLDGPSALGLGLAAFSAIGGTAWVIAARHGYGSVQPLLVTATLLSVSAVALVVVGMLSVGAGLSPLRGATTAGLVLAAAAGVTSAALPMFLFIVGIQRIGASSASTLATVEPLAGIAFAALLLAQFPTPIQVVGGLLIVTGAVLLTAAARGRAAYRDRGAP
jgi:drug/metabolite transporter (DMT)-like permease